MLDRLFHAGASLALLLGVPWEQAMLVGGAIGQKIAFNEFLAYAGLSPTLKAGTLDPRTSAILCFALCGFANLTSVAIQLANLTSAAIAGLFIAG